MKFSPFHAQSHLSLVSEHYSYVCVCCVCECVFILYINIQYFLKVPVFKCWDAKKIFQRFFRPPSGLTSLLSITFISQNEKALEWKAFGNHSQQLGCFGVDDGTLFPRRTTINATMNRKTVVTDVFVLKDII